MFLNKTGKLNWQISKYMSVYTKQMFLWDYFKIYGGVPSNIII